MEDLAGQKYEACRRDASLVSPEQDKELHPKVPDWQIIEVDGIQRLTR